MHKRTLRPDPPGPVRQVPLYVCILDGHKIEMQYAFATTELEAATYYATAGGKTDGHVGAIDLMKLAEMRPDLRMFDVSTPEAAGGRFGLWGKPYFYGLASRIVCLRWDRAEVRGLEPLVPRAAYRLVAVRRADLHPDQRRIFRVRAQESQRQNGRRVGVLSLWRSRFPSVLVRSLSSGAGVWAVATFALALLGVSLETPKLRGALHLGFLFMRACSCSGRFSFELVVK